MNVRIAVEGCGHGTLHAIYASVEQSCKVKGWSGVDLLIICGDFQSVRNAYDLNCVAMPAKYREMCDFHEYYSGKRKAPYLTVFVGGNHEASNYLFELYYGGWVAENIYYIGAANVLKLGPLTIAGMSGIWKGYNYKKLHHERLPYNEDDLKSIYHVREIDTRKLLQYSGDVDIGISHDWPRGVEWHGDWKTLFRRKVHLEPDARSGQLGNVAAKLVLERLRPGHWFSGHLHCKFAAVIDRSEPIRSAPDSQADHSKQQLQAKLNSDEIALDDDDEPIDTVHNGHVTKTVNADEIELDLDTEELPQAPTEAGKADELSLVKDAAVETLNPDEIDPDGPGSSEPPDRANNTSGDGHRPMKTHFLALDKCLAGRDFLQLLEIPVQEEALRPLRLVYDREWLAITRAFAIHEPLLLATPKFTAPPLQSTEEYAVLINEQRQFVQKLTDEDLLVPLDCPGTAPVYDNGDFRDRKYDQAAGGLKEYTNPQTAAFCKLLDIPNSFDIPEEERQQRMAQGPAESDRPFNRDRGRGGHGGRGARGGRGRGRGRGRGW